MRRAFSILIVALMTVGVFLSCASQPEQPEQEWVPRYNGVGENSSLLKAMNAAKMSAVQKAVVDIIGASQEEANRSALEQALYNTSDPNKFVLPKTMETLRKDKIGDKFVYEISIEVDMQAIENTLKANGLMGGSASADTGEQAVSSEKLSSETASKSSGTESGASTIDDLTKVSSDEATEEEKQVIRRYVNNMTYMVYFSEEAEEQQRFLMESAVGIANEYLASQTIETVNLDQIKKIKEDQKFAYEEEMGQEVSLIQWIAQKLNADVYVEIDAAVESETQGDRHFGTANITLDFFESSTGRQLASVTRRSQRAVSNVSQEDAVLNALKSTIYKSMPRAVDQAKSYMAKELATGIKYEVTIINTPDARVMSEFRRNMRRRVKDISTVSQSAEETKYEIRLIGSIERLEDAVYDVADTVPGLEGITQVYLRGKSITFESGM